MFSSNSVDDRTMPLTVITGLLAILVFWLPLPFGSVVPWAHDLLRVSAFLLFPATLCWAAARPRLRRAIIPAASLALLGIFGLAQAASWPIGLARSLSPEHVRLAETSPFAQSGIETVSLSLAPSMTRSISLTWLAAAAFFLIAAVVGASARRRRWLLYALCSAALFQIIYGVRHWMSGSSSIWGVETAKGFERLRGTFVNADHLALYLEIALAAILAWVWWAARRARRTRNLEGRIILLAPPVLLWLTIFAALAFTGSRAGLIAAVIGAVVQGLLVAFRNRRWQVATVGVLAPVAGIFLVAVVGFQAGFGRWLATSQNDLTWNGRLEVYRASLDLWKKFPLTGTGLASFREAFPMVQPADLGMSWWHAHNDFIEILATTGILGALVLLIGLTALIAGLARVVRSAGTTEDAAAGLAALGACAAVAAHSMLDFGMTMPANSITLAILCGAAIGLFENFEF